MSGSTTLVEWHRMMYGKRPALFRARFWDSCCWCGWEISPGEDACYWPEHDATLGHEDCLRIVWRAHL